MPTLIRKSITSDLKNLFPQAQNIQIVKRLLGGMSHYTYLVKIDEQFFTYRYIGPAGNLYVNRKEELFNLETIKQLNINNETVYFNLISGVKISQYVNGTDLTQTDFIYYLDQVATTLKKLHQSDLKAFEDFNYYDTLQLYESFNQKQDEQYLLLKKAWFQLYEKKYQSRDKVFCHNDAQRSNIVISDDHQLYLLDWEYAKNNDPYYDIASFGNIDLNDSLLLLEKYLHHKPTNEEINDVKFYRMFQVLMWHQVAKYKNFIGLSNELKIDFDFHEKNYLQLAQKLFAEIGEKND